MNDRKPETETAVSPLIEEELRAGKRQVVTGRVWVSTVTETMNERVRRELKGERVEVERVSVDTLVEPRVAVPQVRMEGNVTIVPVLEEVFVVEKRLLFKEELRVTRHATTETADLSVPVRKQRAYVERRPADRALSQAESDRLFADRSTEAEERDEEVVLSKPARVTGEVAGTKNVDERDEAVQDTVRSTKVDVDDERRSAANSNRKVRRQR